MVEVTCFKYFSSFSKNVRKMPPTTFPYTTSTQHDEFVLPREPSRAATAATDRASPRIHCPPGESWAAPGKKHLQRKDLSQAGVSVTPVPQPPALLSHAWPVAPAPHGSPSSSSKTPHILTFPPGRFNATTHLKFSALLLFPEREIKTKKFRISLRPGHRHSRGERPRAKADVWGPKVPLPLRPQGSSRPAVPGDPALLLTDSAPPPAASARHQPPSRSPAAPTRGDTKATARSGRPGCPPALAAGLRH